MNDLDTTYCASPGCINKCGRQLILDKSEIKMLNKQNPNWETRICYAYFCNIRGELLIEKEPPKNG